MNPITIICVCTHVRLCVCVRVCGFGGWVRLWPVYRIGGYSHKLKLKVKK